MPVQMFYLAACHTPPETLLRRGPLQWGFRLSEMGTFVTQTAQGELASRKRGKWAHISPVCHPCGSGAWSQLGWPQNWWARETAAPSGPTVGQIFMWAVKYILPHILKNTLPGGSLQKSVAVLSRFNKTFLSISVSGGTFLSPPFSSHANFASRLHFTPAGS